ncbi:SusC/RagA family TonB-linked outer membrane protein [Mucilaginibacter corticis]|nr:SusC/RagA family TonB-linked outer membrane protein [Mucilaginibacter corticis]
MKLSTLLLIIGLVQASAKGYSQVTLNEKHSSLENVLQKIEKQTNYIFIYDEDKLNIADIDVHVSNASLTEALDACFKDMPVSYSIVGNNIILKPAAPSLVERIKNLFDDPITVRGIITDTTGRPLSHATVFFIKRKNRPGGYGNGTAAAGLPVAVPATSNANQATTQSLPQATAQVAVVSEVTYVTDDNGLFYIDAEEGDELGISFVGYKTYTFKVKKNMPFLRVELHAVTSKLREVFVQTGYQKLSKERATGSFSKPDLKIIANRSSTLDLIGRLEGQIPGMIVAPYYENGYNYNQATGTQTQKSVIRGESSIRLTTEPLYVVNGVIVPDFSSVNLDNIADITVLKDAAAAAIWGAQAGNGVIVVTTKAGSRNQRVKISYNGFMNFEGKPDFDYARKRYMSSSQYIAVAKQLFDPADFPYSDINSPYNYNTIAPSQQVLYNQNQGLITAARANAQLDSMAQIDNTKQFKDLWLRNAFTTSHTLSASGGSGTYAIYGSLGYTDSHGSSIGQNSSTYKIDLNQSFTPNDRFSFSLDAQLADNVSSSKSPLAIEPDILPYQLFKDANGNNINLPYLSGWTPDVIKQYSTASGIDLGTYQPLDELDYTNNRINSYAINLVGNAAVRIWKGLQYLGTYGYSVSPTEMLYTQNNKAYSYRKQLLNNTMPGDPPTYLIPVDGEYYQPSNNNQRSWTVRNQLAYTYSGRDGNDLLSLQAGQEANERKANTRQETIYGYDPQLESYPLLDYYTLNQGVFGTVGGYGGYVQQPFRETETVTRYNSYFALASYTLNRKYSIDGSWRRDHSNLFGSDVSAQNKPSYSMGGKWNVKGENFMSPAKWLDALALRGTYGITGNSPYLNAGTVYDVLGAEQIPNYYYPVIGGPAYNLSSPQNNKLSWEATHTTNLAVDFGVLNNRLTGSIEYYHKSTTDLLGSAPENYFTGSTSATTNIGDLVNNGINISLNSTNITTTNFTWQSGFVLGHNTNKLVKYQVPQSYENSPSYRLFSSYAVGYSSNSLFAYRYAGLDGTGDPLVYLANGKTTKKPDVPLGTDLKYMGTTTPKFNGSINNFFRYKQFDLSINITYNLGGVMRRDVNTFYSGMITTSNDLGGNLNVDFLDRWQKPGDEKKTNIPRYLPVENYGDRSTTFYQDADINVVSSSYLKLNEATLSYNLDAAALRWLKIQSASLRLQLNNVLLWKANKYGINPEFAAAQYGARGIPVGQHTITLGANINF